MLEYAAAAQFSPPRDRGVRFGIANGLLRLQLKATWIAKGLVEWNWHGLAETEQKHTLAADVSMP